MTSGAGSEARFERRDATLVFPSAAGPIAVTVCSPRIVRVALGASPTPEISYVAPQRWAPAPFEVTEGEVVRLATRDLRLDVETEPLRLTFSDPTGNLPG